MAKKRLFLDGKEIITASEPTFHIEGEELDVTKFCNGSVYSEKSRENVVIDEIEVSLTDEQQDFCVAAVTGVLEDAQFELEIKNDIDKNYYLKTLVKIKDANMSSNSSVIFKFIMA